MYDEYLNVKQDINLRIIEVLERHGIEIAFPTQQIYVAEHIKENKSFSSENH